MSTIIVPNQKDLKRIKEEIARDGIDSLHIVADFDRTLTRAYINGVPAKRPFSLIREGDYLHPDYTAGAQELFNTYHPIEISNDLSKEEKDKEIKKWWRLHLELMKKYGITQRVFQDIVETQKIQLRDGVRELMTLLHSQGIPLVIMSAGLGDMISAVLKAEGLLFDTVYIVSNFFQFDQEGKATGIQDTIIHSLNKHEVETRNLSFYPTIENRKNVVLLGDSIDDLGMVAGFTCKNIIRIGFQNEREEDTTFIESFDITITDDGDVNAITELVQSLVAQDS